MQPRPGGLILNLMPCVFPILSLKLLSVAQQAHGRRTERVSHGLAYTAGVLVSFAALGISLLALRASRLHIADTLLDPIARVDAQDGADAG